MDGISIVLSSIAGGELDREFINIPEGVDIDDDQIQARIRLAVTALMSSGYRAGDQISIVDDWSEC